LYSLEIASFPQNLHPLLPQDPPEFHVLVFHLNHGGCVFDKLPVEQQFLRRLQGFETDDPLHIGKRLQCADNNQRTVIFLCLALRGTVKYLNRNRRRLP
jgi:hypothetical protein